MRTLPPHIYDLREGDKASALVWQQVRRYQQRLALGTFCCMRVSMYAPYILALKVSQPPAGGGGDCVLMFRLRLTCILPCSPPSSPHGTLMEGIGSIHTFGLVSGQGVPVGRYCSALLPV